MTPPKSITARLFITGLLLAVWPATLLGQVSVLTGQEDIGRTGANLQETYLTPLSVRSGNFQKLISVAVNGNVQTQPLYVPNVQISGVTYNLLIVTTSKNDVYGFDADGGTPLWHITLLDAAHGAGADAGNPPPALCIANSGVFGTPVIDAITGTLYLVGRTWESNYTVQRIHALDITNGSEKLGSPTTIQAAVPGSGYNSFGGLLSFDPAVQMNHPGLLLLNGIVYVGFGADCEPTINGWHGWVMGYDAATLLQMSAWATTPNSTGSGIWMSGAGLAADVPDPLISPFGRMFVALGNGFFNAVPPYTTYRDFGDDFVRLDLTSGILTPQDSFTPSNQSALNSADLDLGSGGVLILPDSVGSAQHPHLLVQASKSGTIYLVDRDNMSGSNTTDAVVQELNSALAFHGMYATPAYWNGNLYFGAANDYLKSFSVSSGLISPAPASVSSTVVSSPGATPSISANGNTGAIVWALSGSGTAPASLQAFDANDLTSILYSSSKNLTRDSAGLRTKFSVPTVVNGKVYVGSASLVNIFGGLFAVDATSTTLQAQPGSSVSTVISVFSAVGSSFTGTVILGTDSLPDGISANFSIPAITLAGSPATGLSLLTFNVASSVTTGTYPIQVTGSSNSLKSMVIVNLAVSAGNALTFSQQILPFSQAIGVAGIPSPLVVTNPGPSDLILSNVAIKGLNSNDFAQTSNCIGTLAAGQSCNIQISFTPRLASENALLVVTDNAFGIPGSTQTVVLNGTGLTPIGVLPASAAFAAQTVSLISLPLAIGLRNTGAAPLLITGIFLGGSNTTDFALTNSTTCGATLAPAASCIIYATFRPSAVGVETAFLTISDNSNGVAGTMQKVALSGTGGLPLATLYTAALTFPAQTDGTRSAAQTITLSNTGTTPLLITSYLISGPNAADFATSSCGSNLAAGKSCTISITFKPVTAGAETATWTIVDNNAGVAGSSQLVTLTGTGIAAPIATLPAIVAFGTQTIGSLNPAVAVTLRNTGTGPLSVAGISVAGVNASDFTVASTTCGASLPSAASCAIYVVFRPSLVSAETAVLTVTDNSSNVTGVTQTVILNGTGGLPAAVLSLSALAFPLQTDGIRSTAQTFTLSNAGTSPLLITSYAITGANAADFATSSCGSSLLAGKICTISITFRPVTAGAESAAWILTSNTGGATGTAQTVALTGIGSAAPIATLPAVLAFGSQTLGWTSSASAIALRNTGTGPLSIAGLSMGGANSDFTITNATTCAASLAPAANCLIYVTFRPSIMSAESATLTVTDNSSGVAAASQNVLLTGAGGLPNASLSVNSLTFPAQVYGTRSPAQSIILTNTGTSPLIVSSYAISGTNAADFSTNSCGSIVAAGKSCSLAITFRPIRVGVESAIWTLTSNSGAVAGSIQTVPLSGTGVTGP